MKNNDISSDEKALIDEELKCLAKVTDTLAKAAKTEVVSNGEDDELVSLRDQLGETHVEDHAMLVEHMTRIAALRRTKQRMKKEKVNVDKPYFGHLQLKDTFNGKARTRQILIFH